MGTVESTSSSMVTKGLLVLLLVAYFVQPRNTAASFVRIPDTVNGGNGQAWGLESLVYKKSQSKEAEDSTATATPTTTTSKNEDSIEEGSEDKSTPCEDTGNNKRSCPRWKTYCNTHEYMKRHCKKTCNICDSPGSTSGNI